MGADAPLAAIGQWAPLLSRSPETVEVDLDRFAALLRKWQAAKNLVSRETLEALWPRHILDSLQLLAFLRPTDRLFLDIGSGGGFPAIPLAIAVKGRAEFVLVESNTRKASFLRTVARELELPVTVHATRAEELSAIEAGTPDVVTSRALAPLPALLSLAQPLCGANTRLLLHKGRTFREELVESGLLWHIESVSHRSLTDPDGVILEITAFSRH